ncbi:hypothetical protein ACTWP4_18420 [Gracilibacillus sp. D59]|uniref:hypothetical protein n=1 Tax=Gracilibacillus sp. D59 TaxID=3457434 RepID=UPI003FCE8DC0
MQEEEWSIKPETDENPELKQMLTESKEQYNNGQGMSTAELLPFTTKRLFTIIYHGANRS